jgi:hypothetical protein
MVRKIKETLLKLYDICIVTHDSKECGTTKIERLLLFNNNGSEMTLAFDSVKDTFSRHEFIKMINDLFGLELDGGRKLSKQKRNNLSKKEAIKKVKKRSNKKIINRRKFSRKL